MKLQDAQTLLDNASILSPQQYLNLCDQLEGFETEQDGVFEKVVKCKEWCIVPLEQFYWPDRHAIIDRHGLLTGYKDCGAHCETYHIVAVNRVTQAVWAVYVSMMDRNRPKIPFLPKATAEAVQEAFNTIWHSKYDAKVAKNNAVIDEVLAKSRELSPDAYIAWCDEHCKLLDDRCVGYNNGYLTNANDKYWCRDFIDGIRFTQRDGSVVDIIGVQPSKGVIIATVYCHAYDKMPVPDLPLLQGHVAEAVLNKAKEITTTSDLAGE